MLKYLQVMFVGLGLSITPSWSADNVMGKIVTAVKLKDGSVQSLDVFCKKHGSSQEVVAPPKEGGKPILIVSLCKKFASKEKETKKEKETPLSGKKCEGKDGIAQPLFSGGKLYKVKPPGKREMFPQDYCNSYQGGAREKIKKKCIFAPDGDSAQSFEDFCKAYENSSAAAQSSPAPTKTTPASKAVNETWIVEERSPGQLFIGDQKNPLEKQRFCEIYNKEKFKDRVIDKKADNSKVSISQYCGDIQAQGPKKKLTTLP